MTFKNDLLTSKARAKDIDNYIDDWHWDPDDNRPLYIHLGFTLDQYKRWVETRSLQHILPDFATLNEQCENATGGGSKAALDTVMTAFDDLLLARQFDHVDHLLRIAQELELGTVLTLGVLTITLASKSKLRYRKNFYEYASRNIPASLLHSLN